MCPGDTQTPKWFSVSLCCQVTSVVTGNHTGSQDSCYEVQVVALASHWATSRPTEPTSAPPYRQPGASRLLSCCPHLTLHTWPSFLQSWCLRRVHWVPVLWNVASSKWVAAEKMWATGRERSNARMPTFESFLLPLPIDGVTLVHSVHEGQTPGFTWIPVGPFCQQISKICDFLQVVWYEGLLLNDCICSFHFLRSLKNPKALLHCPQWWTWQEPHSDLDSEQAETHHPHRSLIKHKLIQGRTGSKKCVD